MSNLIGKKVTTYDGHSGIVITHFKPTGRDMTVYIKQADKRIWYCPETDIIKVENVSLGVDFIEESKNVKLKTKYKRRLKRVSETISKMKKEHGENPCKNYNYYGGWSMGYYEGLLVAYENILDDISFD